MSIADFDGYSSLSINRVREGCWSARPWIRVKTEFLVEYFRAIATSIFTGKSKTFIYRNKLLSYNLFSVCSVSVQCLISVRSLLNKEKYS
jgi:hypothetical protein